MQTINGVRFGDRSEISDAIEKEHLQRIDFDGSIYKQISKWNFLKRKVFLQDLKEKAADYARKIGAKVVHVYDDWSIANYGLLVTQTWVAAEFYK